MNKSKFDNLNELYDIRNSLKNPSYKKYADDAINLF